MIEQYRTCDGACCQASPLRPTEDGADCYFRDPTQPERGCTVMSDPSRLGEMTEAEKQAFAEGCAGWPQNATPETQGDFGACCYRWGD